MTTPTARPALDAESPRVLREYALLADGERGALVGPHGELAWMCAPTWDSDAVFSHLIGGGGSYLVTPVERCVWGGHYEPDTLIWRSRWITDTGIIECHEALAFPGDPHRAVILRQIHAVDGAAHLYLRLQPAAGFGAHPVHYQHRPAPDIWTGRTGPLRWRWSGTPTSTQPGPRGLEATLHLDPGQHHNLVLELSEQPLPDPPPTPPPPGRPPATPGTPRHHPWTPASRPATPDTPTPSYADSPATPAPWSPPPP